MLYAVGTHIDLSGLNDQRKMADVAAMPTRQKKESRLYEAGTKIFFVQALKSTTVLKITPNAIAYIQPAGA